MSHAKNKVQWCLDKAKRELEAGNKHRGLIQIEPNIKRAKEHITKAEHNVEVAIYLYDGGYTDWCSSSLFYAIYHCFLAILAKFGYESRNQECTFALIGSFIDDKKINVKREELEKVSLLNADSHQESPTAVSIREEYQYSTKVSLENNEYNQLLKLAKNILDKAKEIIEE